MSNPVPLSVIPTYLARESDVEVLETTVRTLRGTAFDTTEIILVDDCSPLEGTANHLDRIAAKYRADIHIKDENSGFSKTVNIGLQRALDEERDGILVNADLEFRGPGWVQKMRETRNLHRKEGYAWVVGALLSYPNGLVQHGGVYFSLLVRAFDHLWKYAPENLENVCEYRMCPVTGALQFIRHECLATVGLYDEAFSMAFEDVDYCLRVFIDHKQECVFNPYVRAFHHESLFRGRGDEKVNQWTRESLALLMTKWKDQSMAGLVPTW